MHKCVCLCAVPLLSDPHECVSEVYVLGVVSCVCMCEVCGGEGLQ